MANAHRGTETGQIKPSGLKAYIIITLTLISLVSCSNAVKFKRELPEMIEYHRVEFVECPAEISGYLCIKNTDAINSVIDLKNCQEQNHLLREMLDGN